MAHIVVYLQRTTRGLHPGSTVASCLAREVADARGASVISLCLGDAGTFDDRVLVGASRSGTDQVVFLGPEGIQKLFKRLSPRHVFAPYTNEAGSVLAQAGIGPMVGRWMDGPPENPHKLEPVIGVVAGGLGWRQTPLQIEPEYEADVTQVELADWLVNAAEQISDLSRTAEQPPVLYFQSEGAGEADLDEATRRGLANLGAYAVGPDEYQQYGEATLLWLDATGEGLPLTLVERNPGIRVILLSGERETRGSVHSSWGMADYVLPGEWPEALELLNTAAWKAVLF